MEVPIYKKVNKSFFKQWSGKMAYVLGFVYADGNVLCSKRNTWFWSIQITDRSLLYAIKNTIDSDHIISKRLLVDGNKQLYRLQIGSKEMCEDLLGYGVTPRKSLTMRFPVTPQGYFNDFLRGYFDGDGHVWMGYKNKAMKGSIVLMTGFTCGSIEFLREFQRTLKRRCTLSGGSIVKKERGYELKYSIVDSLKIYKNMYNTDYGTLYLPRKKRIFEKFISLRT